MDRKILDSWKEIARYLQRDVRTCQRWEKEMGLPVHRFEDASRSRVFAYQDELDKWLKEKSQRPDLSGAKKKVSTQIFKWSLGTLIILLVLIVTWRAIIFFSPREPHDFQIEDNKLIILDQKHRPIWEYEFPNISLSSNETYHSRFQQKKLIPGREEAARWFLPLIYIGDINQDQHKEVLFMVDWNKAQPNSYFYCFDYRGRLLWQFLPQEAPKFGEITYSKFFRNHGFYLEDFNQDGRQEIIAIFNCETFFPTLLVLLDCEGKSLGHYWNSGRLNEVITYDLEGDGQKEIILGAQNNEWRQCAVIVLSPDQVEGASPQTKDYYSCKNTSVRGREKYYLLLPLNEVAAKIVAINAISSIHILDGPRFQVNENKANLIYTFDRNMNLVYFDFSHFFLQTFNELKRKGVYPPEMTAKQVANQIKEKGVRYFDGEKWVKTPTMTRFWKQK